MKQLTDKEALAHGIGTAHHEMDNGELRFRLTCESGSSYILTKSTEGGWQKAHIHRRKTEYYIMEQGYALIALWKNRELSFDVLTEKESICVVPSGVPHSVWMCDHAVMHTVKFGSTDTDWHPYEKLDKMLAALDMTPFL